jgi:type III secretion protein T
MLIGLLIGLPFAVLSWGLEAAGFMIDNQRGSTMASSLNPATGDQSSPIGVLLGQLYTVWMFATGGFLILLELIQHSMMIWSPWSLVPELSPTLPAGMLALLDRVMLLTLLIAGPALMAMFLSEMGLALISRFAPQLQVFFLAMPLKSAVGLLVLVLSLGVVMNEVARGLVDAQSILGPVRAWLP